MTKAPEQPEGLQVHDLTLQLDEAQETLGAIRSGQVDALLIKVGPQQQVVLLKGAERIYQLLFDSLNEGALSLSQDATILYANKRFAELIGRPIEEVLGAPFTRFVAAADVDRFTEALKGAMSGSSKCEIALEGEAGAQVPVMVSMRSMGEGEDGRSTVVITNLTEIKATQAALEETHAKLSQAFAELKTEIAARTRLEAELRQTAQNLMEAGQRKDEFLAMLAHELRNPLASIVHCVELLRTQARDASAVERHRLVIERQARNLTQLVDDLLDVSRITRGQITLQKLPVKVSEIAHAALDSVRPLIESSGHTLSAELPERPGWLDADRTRLEQVLVNLLQNAAKYTERGGQISLRVENAGDEVVFRVRDSGIGIPAELLPRIFDLFVQGLRSLDRSQGGLGIGLTVVRRLVEMHGGSIQAFSEGPGHGSEFVVRLPALERDEAGQTDESSSAGPHAQGAAPALADHPQACKRIMVVEDNVDAADMLREILECWGHRVSVAFSGPEAIEQLPVFRPEIMLIDLGLPGMDGYEVARRVRRLAVAGDPAEEAPLPKPLLVMLTGYGGEPQRQRAREAGFDCYLVKPACPEALQQILQLGREAPYPC